MHQTVSLLLFSLGSAAVPTPGWGPVQSFIDTSKSLFNKPSDTYADESTSKMLIEYAYVGSSAYCVNNLPTSRKQLTDLTQVTFITTDYTQVYNAIRGNEILVVFRGSTNRENWIDNLDFPKVNWDSSNPKSKIHRGYLDA